VAGTDLGKFFRRSFLRGPLKLQVIQGSDPVYEVAFPEKRTVFGMPTALMRLMLRRPEWAANVILMISQPPT